MCLYVLYKTCAGVNIDPMGQTFKKKKKKKKKILKFKIKKIIIGCNIKQKNSK